MDTLKKHVDTVIILTAFAGAFLWIINDKFNDIKKDMAIIKTVLIVRNVMPSELATTDVAK